ncbi:MAG TPA: asparagine synthase (glutamine-hydrolyzing) [Chitinophagales bacterium]|nr:asparagine synthase (glutamine-hydrolyzing) [Chitinophagales bacterium]HMX60426.1 asparagine synthase (glutamine-hydrolyzing) [Chitinophagales bacterium]HMY23489.1 asparagine synthase (glutamine-hydrolyzing) [Chitinophagales bacterium]HNA37891.1 asparagine synthase (glutamine-hydrolyzing) [Chitinophagales bacterium]HNB48948.1 asparagine synthase (glutamine-hydrolyzing) [Chitinophagales bacterium]
MCGIAGAYSFKNKLVEQQCLQNAATSLNKRGPDNQNFVTIGKASLVHARLSIIDTSVAANQPIYDITQRYAIIFNGEIFNYQSVRDELLQKGVQFKTHSDTEVLLYAYIHFGESFLHKLNGFFAFAIHDKQEDTLFIACDRFGIKPLYYYSDDDFFFFGSELKNILQFPIKKEIDWSAVSLYFQMNYIPGKNAIFKNIQRLEPGQQLSIRNNNIEIKRWYNIPYNALNAEQNQLSYEEQKKKLLALMDDSVRLRLIADVPLGAFLSGGIDSSVVTAMASRHTPHLNTFSIGFESNAFFDETPYANLVAKHFKTNHTVFKLKNDDLFESLHELLDYSDEPFADSSALLVNILSKFTRQHVTVALSGDAGDELFAGYNKHYGEWQMRNNSWQASIIHLLQPVWEKLPKSRSGNIANKIRQLERFAKGMDLKPAERWWQWCCINDTNYVEQLIGDKADLSITEMIKIRQQYASLVQYDGTLNDCLLADVNMVLPYDMLTKVDRMSMRNSLEVRVPFLDYRIVEFAFSLPVSSKINGNMKKKIVQDAFREVLPNELYNRPKKGFEVPLLQWFRTDLKDKILNDWLSDEYIQQQGVFNINTIQQLKLQLFSNNPGDVHAQIWALIVFQNFWRKYMD